MSAWTLPVERPRRPLPRGQGGLVSGRYGHCYDTEAGDRIRRQRAEEDPSCPSRA